MATDITLQDAAAQLGVHYMTVYRYVRTGRLDARKHDGQWWVRSADVEAFRAGTLKPPPPPATAPRPRVRRWDRYCDRLVPRLVEGDDAGAWGVVEAALTAGAAPAEVHVDLLAAAMREIGNRWEAGTLSVGDEHRATAVATRLIGRISPRFARRGRRRGAVVLAGVPGDIHAIPVALLADVLRGAGFEVIDFGANTPTELVTRAAAQSESLVAVGLSASTGGREDAIAEAAAAVRADLPHVPLLLGGPAVVDIAAAHALGASSWASDARGAVAVIEDVRKPR